MPLAGVDQKVMVVDASGVEVDPNDTELAAAAAQGDNFANPTTAPVFAHCKVHDGAAWDHMPGTTADGVLVNLGANNDVTVTSGSIALSAAIPAGTNNIGDVDILTVPLAGAHGNAWNAVSTGAGGTSTAIDCQYVSQVSIFGNTSAASNITVQGSQDNTNFYDFTTPAPVAANGNFGFSMVAGMRYVRLKSSADVTATVTISGKN